MDIFDTCVNTRKIISHACSPSTTQNQASTIARPPGPAPSVSTVKQPEKKPRSHTVATDTGSNCALELSSSMEASLEATSSQSSRSGSVEVDRLPSGESVAPWEGKKPIPPPPPSQSSKPGRREQPPPPKPKPFLPSMFTHKPQVLYFAYVKNYCFSVNSALYVHACMHACIPIERCLYQ